MANYRTAHPDDAARVDHWRDDGQFVPLAHNGKLSGLAAESVLDACKPVPPLSTEDFVVGVELLGHTLRLVRMGEDDLRILHDLGLRNMPDSWRKHASQLCEAYGWEERAADVGDFLLARGDDVFGKRVQGGEQEERP